MAFDTADNGVFTYDDGDLIIYIFADEGPCMGEDPPIAFSDECAMDQFDRPVAVSYIDRGDFFHGMHCLGMYHPSTTTLYL